MASGLNGLFDPGVVILGLTGELDVIFCLGDIDGERIGARVEVDVTPDDWSDEDLAASTGLGTLKPDEEGDGF